MTNALAIHGTNQELDTMAGRFKVALRGGDKLANNEARALAQISMVTNLNPYIGEVWYIPGKGPMIGIAGARKLWNEKGLNGGGNSFVEIVPCSPEEAGATEADVHAAFKAIAHDSHATKEYLALFSQTLKDLRAAADPDPTKTARELCGPKPQWVGYGYSTKSETSRMNKTQLARKRAEADALKKCIVIPFGLKADVSIEDKAPEYVDAQVSDVTETTPAMSIEDARQVVVHSRSGDKFIGELPADQLQWLVENGRNPQTVEAARMVLSVDFNMGDENE